MSKIQQAEKKLSRLIGVMCSSSSASERFFGIHCASMERKVTPVIPSIATNGTYLMVNPDWVLDNTDNDLLYVLAHEAFHKVAKHAIRLRDTPYPLVDLRNIAFDNAVNLALNDDQSFRYRMPDGGYADDRFRDENGKPLNAERIMRMLLDELPPPQPNPRGGQGESQQGSQDNRQQQKDSGGQPNGDSQENNQQPPDGGSGPSGADDQDKPQSGGQSQQPQSSPPQPENQDKKQPREEPRQEPQQNNNQESGDKAANQDQDVSSQPPNPCGELHPADREDSGQETDRVTAKAEAVAKAIGSMPKYLKELIETSLEGKYDWMAELKQLLSRTFDKSDFTLRKPNPRYAHFGTILPSMRQPAVNKIVIGIDTSGSMSADELSIAANQVIAIANDWRPQELHVVQCDAKIHKADQLSAGMQITSDMLAMHGRGGTAFGPMHRYADKIGADALLIISDMMPSDWKRHIQPPGMLVYLSTTPGYGQNWYDGQVRSILRDREKIELPDARVIPIV